MESTKLSTMDASYINRNRSQSFSEKDNFNSFNIIDPPRPPPRRDFGVMCGVLTRNVGVGHQIPHTKTVSTLTVNNSDETPTYSDKWYKEKIKFLTNQNENDVKVKSQNTQTPVARKTITIDCGTQTPPPKVEVVKRSDNYTQTSVIAKQVFHVGSIAKPINSNIATQTNVDTRNVGISIETPCEKCNIVKVTVGVGPENTVDAHISPVSLANLAVPRSKSFNLGNDKLNLSIRNRTVGCQYETSTNTVASQYEMKTYSKACQSDTVKTLHKGSQHESSLASKVTDTKGLGPEKVNVACEAKELVKKKVDFACSTDYVSCAKCAAKEREKEEHMRKEGSPTPSRIPRPQVPTTPVENRKFRRQDTYTKIPASSTEKPQSSPTG